MPKRKEEVLSSSTTTQGRASSPPAPALRAATAVSAHDRLCAPWRGVRRCLVAVRMRCRTRSGWRRRGGPPSSLPNSATTRVVEEMTWLARQRREIQIFLRAYRGERGGLRQFAKRLFVLPTDETDLTFDLVAHSDDAHDENKHDINDDQYDGDEENDADAFDGGDDNMPSTSVRIASSMITDEAESHPSSVSRRVGASRLCESNVDSHGGSLLQSYRMDRTRDGGDGDGDDHNGDDDNNDDSAHDDDGEDYDDDEDDGVDENENDRRVTLSTRESARASATATSAWQDQIRVRQQPQLWLDVGGGGLGPTQCVYVRHAAQPHGRPRRLRASPGTPPPPPLPTFARLRSSPRPPPRTVSAFAEAGSGSPMMTLQMRATSAIIPSQRSQTPPPFQSVSAPTSHVPTTRRSTIASSGGDAARRASLPSGCNSSARESPVSHRSVGVWISGGERDSALSSLAVSPARDDALQPSCDLHREEWLRHGSQPPSSSATATTTPAASQTRRLTRGSVSVTVIGGGGGGGGAERTRDASLRASASLGKRQNTLESVAGTASPGVECRAERFCPTSSWWVRTFGWWLSPRLFALALCVIVILLAGVTITVGNFNCTYFLRGRLCQRPGQQARYYTRTSTCTTHAQTTPVSPQYTVSSRTLRAWMDGVYADLDEALCSPFDGDSCAPVINQSSAVNVSQCDARARLTRSFQPFSVAVPSAAQQSEVTPSLLANRHLPQSRRQTVGFEMRVAALVEARRRTWEAADSQSHSNNSRRRRHTVHDQKQSASPHVRSRRQRRRLPRVRFASYTNQISPTGCTLVASAALSGFQHTLLGFQGAYGHVARHLRHLEWIDREGLEDEDVVVFSDSDMAWTGADVAPFIAKFIDLSPSSEAELDVAKVRAWEDYGEALAHVVMADMRPEELLHSWFDEDDDNDNDDDDSGETVKNKKNHGDEGTATTSSFSSSASRRAWGRLVQMPPILFNAESSCQRSHAVQSEAQCQSEADLLELMIAARRNRPASLEKDLVAFVQAWSRNGEEDQSFELRDASESFLTRARVALRASFMNVPLSATPSSPSNSARVQTFASTLSSSDEKARRTLAAGLLNASSSSPEGEAERHRDDENGDDAGGAACVSPRPRFWGIEQADASNVNSPSEPHSSTATSSTTVVPTFSLFHYLDGATRLNPAATPLAGSGFRYCAPHITEVTTTTATAVIHVHHSSSPLDPKPEMRRTADPAESGISAAVNSNPSSQQDGDDDDDDDDFGGPIDTFSTDTRQEREDDVATLSGAHELGSSPDLMHDAGLFVATDPQTAHEAVLASDSQSQQQQQQTRQTSTLAPFDFLSDSEAQDGNEENTRDQPDLLLPREESPDDDDDDTQLGEESEGSSPSASQLSPSSSSSSSAQSETDKTVRLMPVDNDDGTYQPRTSARRVATDPDYYFANLRGVLNPARHLNAGGFVTRVWAYRQLVRAMVRYSQEHFPLDVVTSGRPSDRLARWLKTHGGKPIPLSAAARKALYGTAEAMNATEKRIRTKTNVTTPSPSSSSSPSCHSAERRWHNDQSIIASMYVYGRVWEIEEDLLLAPFTATAVAAGDTREKVSRSPWHEEQEQEQKQTSARRLDPFGLPPGLMGIDRTSEFFFVTPFTERGTHYVVATDLDAAPHTNAAVRNVTSGLKDDGIAANDKRTPLRVSSRLAHALAAARHHLERFLTSPLALLWATDPTATSDRPTQTLMRESGQSEWRVRRALDAQSFSATLAHLEARVVEMTCPLYLLHAVASEDEADNAKRGGGDGARLLSGQTGLWHTATTTFRPPPTGLVRGRLFDDLIARPVFPFAQDACTEGPQTTQKSTTAPKTQNGERGKDDRTAVMAGELSHTSIVPSGSARDHPSTDADKQAFDPYKTRPTTGTQTLPSMVLVKPPLFARRLNTQDVLRHASRTAVSNAMALSHVFSRTVHALSSQQPQPQHHHKDSPHGDATSISRSRHIFPLLTHTPSRASYVSTFCDAAPNINNSNNTNVTTAARARCEVLPDDEARSRAVLSPENRCLLALVVERWDAVSDDDGHDGGVDQTDRLAASTAEKAANKKKNDALTRVAAASDSLDDWVDQPTRDFVSSLTSCLSALTAASRTQQQQAADDEKEEEEEGAAASAERMEAARNLWRRTLRQQCVLRAPPALGVPSSSLSSSPSSTQPSSISDAVLQHASRVEAAAEAWMRARLWHDHAVEVATFPRLVHFAGDWKDIRYQEHRHGFGWFVPGRYDTVARQLNEAALRALEVEWVGEDSVHYFNYEGLCGSPYTLV